MLQLKNVCKSYPGGVIAVDHLTLQIDEGECVVLLGPSGCGKTTTLRMINRLIAPTSGTIHVGGENIERIDPIELRRRIGYVIQGVGLLPHMTISQNISLVPKLIGWSQKKREKRADELLEMIGLKPSDYRHQYPHQLSGGQQQRIGVARALAADPYILLMDEPFGALDPITRAQLQDEFLNLSQKVRKTIVFVTHDLNEALKLSNRIALMKDGALHQYAKPLDLLRHPADEFVIDFIGGESVLYQLKVLKVADIMVDEIQEAEGGLAPDSQEPVRIDDPLDVALGRMLQQSANHVRVVDEQGNRRGFLATSCFHNLFSNPETDAESGKKS
jgi:osmoprotectant transport system ATP-binding protein